jgi:LysR family transcriptional regulator, low CO2-responsive transcriptional regulator
MPQANIGRYLKHGTLPQLRVFEASARLGSFARAAQELHVAPATASVQIKKLTETIGLPLFEQVGKHIYLTHAGQRLYTSCSDLFQSLSLLEESLVGMRGLTCGRLRLAVTSTARFFAPRLLGAFVERYPGIDPVLYVHNRDGLLERLERNADDLYIFAYPPRDSTIMTQVILPNPLVVFARWDHPLAGVNDIPFARLAQEPLLMREPGSGTRMVTLELFARHRLAPKTKMELGSDDAIREAILAGAGVGILSRYMLGQEPQEARLVCLDVEDFPLESYWHFVYPVGKQLSPAARAFMDFTRETAKGLMRISLQPGRSLSPAREDEPGSLGYESTKAIRRNKITPDVDDDQ